jgi:GNAT superfamily N-acetyltransferase
MSWQIERLKKTHDRSVFSSGNASLDDFLRLRVNQYQKRNLGRTFVAVLSTSLVVQGYYTLTATSIPVEGMPAKLASKLPIHPVPPVLLARLAVDQQAQGMGLGEQLLLDALERSLALAQELGIHAVVVNAIDERAALFYRKYGFESLLDDPLHQYMSTTTIQQVLGR